jgi:uncharacterized protein (TIGR00255 family)
MPLQSMTSFATLDVAIKKLKFRTYLKSFNGKGSDIKLRIPKEWASIEIEIKTYLSTRLSRGTIEFAVEDFTNSEKSSIENPHAQSYFKKLWIAVQETRKTGPWFFCAWFRAYALIHNPSLFFENEKGKSPEVSSIDELSPFLDKLCEQFIHGRKREGANLKIAMSQYLKNIEMVFLKLKNSMPEMQRAWESQTRDRITKTLKDHGVTEISQDRILQEIVFIAEKRSVEEEIVRIDTHLKEINRVIEDESIGLKGKRLEFLLQELHREWTTFGNKIQNQQISLEIIDAKLEIDKLKEQSLNIL